MRTASANQDRGTIRQVFLQGLAAAFFIHASATLLTTTTARAQASEPDIKAVAKTYADIAEAIYSDTLKGAKELQKTVDALIAKPSPATLETARTAWLAVRVPYQQSEVYRFGNAIVDEWEGKVNAWPLDEGLIDYVDAGYGKESEENALYAANVIANTSIRINGETVDTSKITKSLLEDTLQEAGGIEANVATGFHAVEFLLWGQDLNGTGAGAGARPATDFNPDNCTNGACDRRAAYLKTATDLLVEDIAWMAAQWGEKGDARIAIMFADRPTILRNIFTGIGSLSYGELAGERMKLGLLLHDPEEEHDCFADNTHNSHYYNALGIQNVYLGRYTRTDGTKVAGPSVSDIVQARGPDANKALTAAVAETMKRMTVLKTRGDTVERYDQMIAEGNAAGNRVVQDAIDGLLAQTRAIQRAVTAVDAKDVTIVGSESLDGPAAQQ
ncbi:MAG: imelysin family protein [Pseudomonadota bacterium]